MYIKVRHLIDDIAICRLNFHCTIPHNSFVFLQIDLHTLKMYDNIWQVYANALE